MPNAQFMMLRQEIAGLLERLGCRDVHRRLQCSDSADEAGTVYTVVGPDRESSG